MHRDALPRCLIVLCRSIIGEMVMSNCARNLGCRRFGFTADFQALALACARGESMTNTPYVRSSDQSLRKHRHEEAMPIFSVIPAERLFWRESRYLVHTAFGARATAANSKVGITA